MTESSALRIAILCSFNLDLIVKPLTKALTDVGLFGELHLGSYGQWQGELLDEHSSVQRFRPTTTLLFLDAEDMLPSLASDAHPTTIAEAETLGREAWARARSGIDAVISRGAGTVICHTMVAPPSSGLAILEGNAGYSHAAAIDTFNALLRAHAASEPRVLVFGYDALVRDHGYARWHDRRLWHHGRMRLAAASMPVLAKAYVRYLAALHTPRRKCLVLDLDNTLWGGVLGEDGLGGIQIGHSGVGLAFREFQLAILALYHRGVILAVASKNNPADALEALRSHPDMVLRPEHFAVLEIHWSEKSESIRRIAERLNIGIDSLVFWDDNPVERGVVASQLPEVLVPEVPEDPTEYAAYLRELPAFDVLSLTREDQNRGRMYREQAERDSFLEGASAGDPASSRSLDAYYASLEMVVHIEAATDVAIPRIAQLTQRTNQFNLTTRRYSEAEIRSRVADGSWRVYGLSLRDRFGDLGLVGAALVQEEPQAWILDTLLMSCRALGRRVEEAFVAHLIDLAARSRKPLRGVFIPTKKNAPIREMLERHGWLRDELQGTESKQYQIELTSAPIPSWLRVVVVEPRSVT